VGLPAPDLGGSKGPGPPTKVGPTMFVCLAICATCACHLVIFSEESYLVDTISYRSARRQYFTWILFSIVTKQLLHFLVSWKSVRYLNLVNAWPSHIEHILLSLDSFLAEFRLPYSDLYRQHTSHMSSIVDVNRATIRLLFRVHVHFFQEKFNILRGHSKMSKCPPFRIFYFT